MLQNAKCKVSPLVNSNAYITATMAKIHKKAKLSLTLIDDIAVAYSCLTILCHINQTHYFNTAHRVIFKNVRGFTDVRPLVETEIDMKLLGNAQRTVEEVFSVIVQLLY